MERNGLGMDSPFKGSNHVFRDKEPFKEGYTPDEILERGEEIQEYAAALQDIPDGFGAPNVFIYGQTGVGKTATTQKVIEFLEAEADDADVALTTLTVNCNKRTSTYKVLQYLANELYPEEHFKQGTHPDTLWDRIYDALDEIGGYVIVILDEIDKLGEDEELLYDFPRAKAIGELENAEVGIVGISNNFKFRENLSQRVKSTLCEKEIQFSPYDANELRSILSYYADLTFRDGVLSEDVIPLTAALTAQDSGDARMALDLLETAGDIARHEGDTRVLEDHVRIARSEVDRANTRDIITERLTSQMQLVLMATTLLVIDPDGEAKVKTIYSLYKDLCDRVDADTLSESRVRDHLDTLEMFGLLEKGEHNLGRRGGRSYIYSLVDEPRIIVETFREDERLEQGFPSSVDSLLGSFEDSTRSHVQSEFSV
ncbi:cell division control protein Cdc6 [Halarchaeum nitratireducens]|uniref:ORC1-type DNA replication protein n=2 Tax=Halarchaeum nitratireducens TaxID=489913 RepID=A0A830GCV2_9EURY|nr:cell division control protein Cdc6 [Halarchaeum nitratireducens]